MPHFRYQPELLDKLFQELAATRVNELYVELTNPPKYIKEHMWETLRDEPDEIKEVYHQAERKQHRRVPDEIVAELIARYNFRFRLDETLYHRN